MHSDDKPHKCDVCDASFRQVISTTPSVVQYKPVMLRCITAGPSVVCPGDLNFKQVVHFKLVMLQCTMTTSPAGLMHICSHSFRQVTPTMPSVVHFQLVMLQYMMTASLEGLMHICITVLDK